MSVWASGNVLPVFVAFCILLGGASAAGFVANGILQLAALAILFWLARTDSNVPEGSRTPPIWLPAAILTIILLQLIPLPPQIWESLPGRDVATEGYAILGIAAPWHSLSMDPDKTISSGVACMPLVASFLLTARVSADIRDRAIQALFLVTILSVLLGALQLSGGAQSPWYLYSVTNRGSAVGFFANTNHLATLYLITLPLAAAMAANARRSRRQAKLFPVFVGVFVFFLLGSFLNGSSAGHALLLVALPISAAIYMRGIGRPLSNRWVAIFAIAAAAFLAFLLFGPFSARYLNKALSTTSTTTRHTSMALTAQAARDYFPFGSGLGTFRWVYPGYEDLSRINSDYVNHAHNDWLELLLETGVFGIALAIAFAGWFALRVRAIWAGSEPTGSVARAATAAVLLAILHSLVDYPERTAAISAVTGMMLGIVAVPAASRGRGATAAEEPTTRKLSGD